MKDMQYNSCFLVNFKEMISGGLGLEIKNLSSKNVVPIIKDHDSKSIENFIGEARIQGTGVLSEFEIELDFFDIKENEQFVYETLKGLNEGYIELEPAIRVFHMEGEVIIKAELMAISFKIKES